MKNLIFLLSMVLASNFCLGSDKLDKQDEDLLNEISKFDELSHEYADLVENYGDTPESSGKKAHQTTPCSVRSAGQSSNHSDIVLLNLNENIAGSPRMVEHSIENETQNLDKDKIDLNQDKKNQADKKDDKDNKEKYKVATSLVASTLVQDKK